MLADYHMHSYYSDDSTCPMEKMVQKAIKTGLDEITFTEHVDYGVKTDENCNYPEYLKELTKLKEKYADRITIKAGIEFGVQKQTIPMFEKDAEEYPFEFIILSNHQVDNKEFWIYEFQEGKTQEEYQTAYYQAIYDVIKEYKDYSVLGHLDYIKRYDKCGEYPDEKIRGIVEKIFRQVIADGKGIEVNTSCFKYGLKDLTPSRQILSWYHEMGGKIITIGSDSHDLDHIGDHIVEVKAILKDIGFNHFCTFENRQPVFHEL